MMDQATVQKLHKAIEARVRAEIAWHDALNCPRGQLSEHRSVFNSLKRARRVVERILDREFDPKQYAELNHRYRSAMAVSPPKTGDDFGPVAE